MIPVDPRWAAVTVAAWLLSYAVHSTLLLGCVAFLSRWKKLPANLEQTLWKTALLGSLVTATVVVLGWDGGTLGARIHLAPTPPASGLLSNPGFLQPASDPFSAELPTFRTWIVLIAWALTGAWGLLRLDSARRRLEAQLSQRRILTSGPHRETLDGLRQSAGIRRPIRLTVSANLGSPIAIGDDEICLPERALTDLRPEEIRSALAHELAHLAHRDPGWKGLAAGLGAVFFFQPFNRAARRRLDETAEFLADDWAVRHSGGEVFLARCLATVAEWQSPRLQTAVASGMADGASPLFRRVERILGSRPVEPARAWCYAGAALLLLGGWMFAPGVTTESHSLEAMPMQATMELLAPPDLPSPPAMPEESVQAPEADPRPPVMGFRHRMRLRHPGPMMARRPLAPESAIPPETALPPQMAERSLLSPLPDRDTAPVARVIIIPHEVIRARLEMLRALPRPENLDPEMIRALIEAEHRLMEMELSQRGVQILWMIEPPMPPEAPAPPASHI